MAAVVVMRASRIARTARFFNTAPAARFFAEPARQKSRTRRLLNACSQRFLQAQPGAANAFRRVRLFVVVAEIALRFSSSPHRRDLQDRQADFVRPSARG